MMENEKTSTRVTLGLMTWMIVAETMHDVIDSHWKRVPFEFTVVVASLYARLASFAKFYDEDLIQTCDLDEKHRVRLSKAEAYSIVQCVNIATKDHFIIDDIRGGAEFFDLAFQLSCDSMHRFDFTEFKSTCDDCGGEIEQGLTGFDNSAFANILKRTQPSEN